ncbi:MAG: LamG-like jellyroll fold domain-containing protein, partial [Rhodospirillales bacterium]
MLGDSNIKSEGAYLFVENGKFVFDTFGATDLISTTTVNDQQWHHVAMTREGTTVKLYVDGNLEATGTYTFTVPQASSRIGSDNLTERLEVDETRIWSDARTGDEIAANYQKQLAGNENNLTAYYRFDDDPDGTTIANKATSTGSALNGTLSGDARIVNVPAHAANFDGDNDHLLVGRGTGDELAITGDITVEARVKLDTLKNQAIFSFSKQNDSGGEDAPAVNSLYEVRIDSNGDIIVGHETGNGTNVFETFDTNLVTGQWYHIAMVRDVSAKTYKVLVNGVPAGIVTYTEDNPTGGSDSELYIGAEARALLNDYLDGQLSDVRIWNVARTDADIHATHNQTVSGNAGGTLLLNLTMDEETGSVIVDQAGNNNATPVGGVTIVDTAPTIQGAIGEIQENSTLSGQMTGNDVAGTPAYSVEVTGKTTSAADADGRVSVETANGGTVIIDTSSGAWTYTPANNWYGNDSFTLTASGDNATADSDTITVTVNNDVEKSIVINDGVLQTTGAAGTHASGTIGTSTISNTATIEFKVNLSELTGAIQAMVTVADSDGTGRYLAALKATGELYFFLSNGAGTSDQVDTGIILETNQWHDIATTYDGSTANIYLDGNLVGSKAISGIALPSGEEKIIIGSRYDETTNHSNALFDEVKVWSEARTHAQIRDGIDQPVASGTDNLEAYYKFDDQVSGTTVQDKSGNNRDLTLNGNAKVIDDIRGAVSLDGTDDVITIASDASLNGTKGTWSVWMKTDLDWGVDNASGGASTRGNALLMGRSDEVNSNNGITLTVNASGQVEIAIRDGAGEVAGISGSANVADGAWHQITVSYDQAASGLQKVYIDGVLIGVKSASGAWSFDDTALTLGKSIDAFWEEFKGEIGGVRLYNTQLTDAQVADQFTNEIDPASSGLIGSYNFTEGTGTTAANDATGATQTPDATVTGATWLDYDNDITATTLVIQEDEVASGRLLANDVPGTPSYGVETAATSGTVTVNADGTWHYKPAANFYGTDTFTLKITSTDADGTAFSDTETITVTINSVDDGNAVQLSDGALSLDGVNDWVNLPNTILSASQGTVSMRVNLPADAPTGSFKPLFANRDDADGDRVYIFAEFTGGQWHLKATLDDKTIDGGVISADTWYETTLVWRTDNTGEFYVDGDSKGSVTGLSL